MHIPSRILTALVLLSDNFLCQKSKAQIQNTYRRKNSTLLVWTFLDISCAGTKKMYTQLNTFTDGPCTPIYSSFCYNSIRLENTSDKISVHEVIGRKYSQII